MRIQFLVCAIAVALFQVEAWAENTEVKQLCDDALLILKNNMNRQASPEEYASAIVKLEKAQTLLEGAGNSDDAQASQVSMALFWARRFADVKVIAALDKLRAGEKLPLKPAPEKKPEPAPAPAPPAKQEGALPDYVPQTAAKAAFAKAEAYAKQFANDDYLVSIAWYKMANEHSGSDYSLKALELARAAQERFAAKTNVKTSAVPQPDAPEMTLFKQVDELLKQDKYDKAIQLLKDELAHAANLPVSRKLGQVYYASAQKIKQDFLAKMDELAPQYQKAWQGAWHFMGRSKVKDFNNNYGPWMEAQDKHQQLLSQLNTAHGYLAHSRWEFEKVLKAAPDNRDLDAVAHIALCQAAEGSSKSIAQDNLKKLLRDYTPANQIEFTLYDFCKTELARVSTKSRAAACASQALTP